MNEQKSKTSNKLFKWAAATWIAANLLPYLFVGETWGMSWMYCNMPLSFWLESVLADIAYPHVFVFVTTVLNGCVFALVISLLIRLLRGKCNNQ